MYFESAQNSRVYIYQQFPRKLRKTTNRSNYIFENVGHFYHLHFTDKNGLKLNDVEF